MTETEQDRIAEAARDLLDCLRSVWSALPAEVVSDPMWLDDLFAVKGWALAEEGEIEADAPGPPGWNPTPPEGGYTAKDF